MTYYDYTAICIGYRDKHDEDLRIERNLQWLLYKSFVDPKKSIQSIEKFWPLESDSVKPIIVPSQEELKKIDEAFRNLGNGRRKPTVSS